MEEQYFQTVAASDTGSQSSCSGSETMSEGDDTDVCSEETRDCDCLNEQHPSDFETLKAEGKEEGTSVVDDDDDEEEDEEFEPGCEEHGEGGDNEMLENVPYPKSSNPEVIHSSGPAIKFKRELSGDVKNFRRGSLGGALTVLCRMPQGGDVYLNPGGRVH
ncbi:hypothetical protein DPEC_G00324190 [Dallia pectoralis]|uniref:Uncharacterized protein n=1 Tax=Dallia pectoralis TaxID=75939 RepID=A0ACC2FAY4_DALPE|nr:hypothetical protein DPEC_G00324190 [Dallia pectoralis]